MSRVSIPCVIFIIFIISVVKLVNSTFFLYRWNTTRDSMTYNRTAMKIKNKKNKKDNEKDWHVTFGRKEFSCCSWLWIWLRVCLIHYLSFAIFFSSERKAYEPKFTKKQFSTHWNNNIKQETLFVFVKFTNCNNWMFSQESPME